MTYLDNAATTYPKPRCVYAALKKSLKTAVGNPGRSSHRAALAAAEEIYSTREALADFLSFSAPERIVFTQNATYALNLAIRALTPRPRHAIYSVREHNSVIRPIAALQCEGLSHSVFEIGEDPLGSMEAVLQKDTDLCVLSLCSNVTGECFPLSSLREFRKRHPEIRVILDGSQWLGHLPFSLSEPICDILCAPGHKALFGIQGAGFAVFVNEGEYSPFAFGGSGNESQNPAMPMRLPERLEAGTLPTPAIASLRAGVRFLSEEGMDAVSQKIGLLTEKIYERLDAIKHARVLSRDGFGIVSFNFEAIPSTAVTAFLDTRGICVRGGLHCAPLIHKAHKTEESGAVRASVSYLCNECAPDRLFYALREFEKIHY